MATYAIGDIQGCYRTLQALLKRIAFDVSRDQLWLAGDLVNRGPASLEVLEWAYEHRGSISMVLGNHDLHLVCCALGVRQPSGKDTLTPILKDPRADTWLHWLLSQPLLHRCNGWVLVHAGLLPQWSIAQAEQWARCLEQDFSTPQKATPLLRGWGNISAEKWKPDTSTPRNRLAALNAFVTLRICRPDGHMQLAFTGPIHEIPPGFFPWFEARHRVQKHPKETVVCGHWAALGFYHAPGVWALDSGCVWGRKLTALRLEDCQVFQEAYCENDGKR